MPSTAGPFLRYGNCLPDSKVEWHGSVLFLTKEDRSEGAPTAPEANITSSKDTPPSIGANGKPETHGDLVPPPAPVLTLDDGSTSTKLNPLFLDNVLGWSFWRFDLTLQLNGTQRPIQYTVTPPSSTGSNPVTATFWLPAAGQPYHWAYTSCNGLSGGVEEDHYAAKDKTYLWRDMLQVHAAFPIHALIGGGDQVYSDPVWKKSELLKAWSDMEDLDEKKATAWSAEHESQAVAFYLDNYIESFTMADVSEAYASIPSVMIWDDHDIWDGYGSYDVELQECPVFKGLFAVAKRFYLLFQQQTTEQHAQTSGDFPKVEEGYHSVKFMGPQVALLCIDMRTKRSKKEILPQSNFQLVRDLAMELPPGVEHVVILSGVPLIFPNIPWSEEILSGFKSVLGWSSCARNLASKAGITDRFGQPEILDDLLDGWAAKIHKEERIEFIHLLQEIASNKGVRVSVLSGDAHVGGVGRLYSRKRPKLDPREDPLFMVQVISSAIMNAPPPLGVVSMLMRTNFAKNVDANTRQKMVRAFWPAHPRSDKLIAQRNWCDVAMLVAPYALPGNPADPDFGGLRFALRVENPDLWRGYAEEVYEIVAPRYPQRLVKAPAEA